MKFLLAPDSFKESMTAKEACIAMEKGILKIIPNAEIIHVPMADGGEGTMEALVDATNGKIFEVDVTAPLGNKVKGKYGILGDGKTAIIEIAQSSGLHLVKKEKRNPLIATTYGIGELIKAVLDKGIGKIIIGLGGSATNDGGVGMLQALGASFKDKEGAEIKFGGASLINLCTIDLSSFDKRIKYIDIEVACDVTNPLLGKNGASYVFGPQKGATDEMVYQLEKGLSNYVEVVNKVINKNIDNIEGAGAAGGLGAALVGFCNGRLRSGVELVIEYSALKDKLDGCDYVFTGEGSIDYQTKFGKTLVGVSKIAKEKGIPVIAFAGRIGTGINELYSLGVKSIICIMQEVVSLEEALKQGKDNLERTVENVVRIVNTI